MASRDFAVWGHSQGGQASLYTGLLAKSYAPELLLVGVAALFAGYDLNIYGLATPQIQASLHIAENQLGLTLTYFRSATLVALLEISSPGAGPTTLN